MEAIQSFAFEQYDPKRFEGFLRGLKASVSQEDNQKVTKTLLNPMAFLLTPVNRKGLVTMLTDPNGGVYIPAYTTLQEAMKNIHFDPACRMVPCSIAMYANMMEADERIAGLSINFVEVPGQPASGMALSRQNVLDMKEPYLRVAKAYRELQQNAHIAPVTLYTPDEVTLSQVRIAIGNLLKERPAVKSGYAAMSVRKEDEKETKGLFYVLSGEFGEEIPAELKEELAAASKTFVPEDWLVEIASAETEVGKSVLGGALQFY